MTLIEMIWASLQVVAAVMLTFAGIVVLAKAMV